MLALVAVTLIAFAVGIGPWFDITERGWAAAIIGAVWLLVAFARARTLLTASQRRARLWELALGVVSSLFPASLLSALSLLAYGAGLGVILVLSALGLDVDTAHGTTAEDIAFGFSFVVAMSMCPGCAMLAVGNTSQQLYPRTAGVQVAYTTLLAEKRRRTKLLLAALPALAAGAATLALPSDGWVLATQVLVLLWSSTVFRLGRVDRRPDHAVLVARLTSAFQAAGYLVVGSPRTGDPALDPLVAGVDLLAYERGGRAFAVQLETVAGTESRLPWADAASVGLAASTLADVAWQLDVRTGRVEPVLVVSSGPPSDELCQFADREHVKVLALDDASEDEIAAAVAALGTEVPA